MVKLNKKQQSVVNQMQPLLKTAPWIIRVTERKEFTGPVLEICERTLATTTTDAKKSTTTLTTKRTKLKEWGRLYNGHLRVSLPALRNMLMNVTDEQGRSLGLQLLFDNEIAYRGQIPLDETIGGKLSLLFRLHPQVRSIERVELMAWRIERFSREETMYWLSKVSISSYGKRSVEWAKSGLRLMLAGQQRDKSEVQRLIEYLRK